MIKTGNPVISIYTEMTPNPETMKFVANKLLYPGKSIDFPDEASAAPSPLAQELFTFPFIRSVFIASNFITLTKTNDTDDWQDDADQLRTLEARLEELNNPACQLLLQGVRSDRKRIDGTVERLRSAK